ncbi:MAG: hypothetical protein ABR500_05050 [Dermatophilaceae bacterium]|nr:hypothetical protein [Intrasporangiaceae bacterium]
MTTSTTRPTEAWPCARPVEHPVVTSADELGLDDECRWGLAPDNPFGGPVGDVIAALDGARAMVRELFATVVDAGAEQRVGMDDLAAVVESAALLERAASAVGVASIAGYARRETHDDAGHPERGATSIRARGFVDEWAAPAVGHLLRIAARTADTRVTRSADLSSVMPHTVAAVADGHLELWQALCALEVLRDAGADDETIRAVDAWLSNRLATGDPTRLKALTRYALGRIKPDLLPDTARKNRARRAIERWECDPGLSEITARVPTEKAAAIWEAATTLAKDYIVLDPSLTLDQARCDAFVDLLLSDVTVTTHVTLGVPVVTSAYAATGETPVPAPDPEDPGPGGRTAAAGADLPGEADGRYRGPGSAPLRVPDWAAHPRPEPQPTSQSGSRSCGAAPAGTSPSTHRWWLSGVHLPGLGYIPPDVVQALTCELGTVISTAILDSARGTLVSHIHEGYRPPTAMRRMIQVRDGRCRAFGCTRPATGCDLDHATSFDRNGATSGANLAGLCRFHHRTKQQKEWRYLLDPDTAVTWWIHAVTGAMRTTVADICLGVHDPAFTSIGPPPEPDNGDDRVPVPTGDHVHDPENGVVASARTRIPDPTIPF